MAALLLVCAKDPWTQSTSISLMEGLKEECEEVKRLEMFWLWAWSDYSVAPRRRSERADFMVPLGRLSQPPPQGGAKEPCRKKLVCFFSF